MSYKRYINEKKLTKNEKINMLEEYNNYYISKFKTEGLESLNVKIPRDVFKDVLDKIGCLLIEESKKLSEDAKLKTFLSENKLPPHMKESLPDDFRTFSLLLNALKQWISAESAATDKYLLGGTARNTCRNVMVKCIITGEKLGTDSQLHHPMRDGRPPILLSKNGHTIVERNNQDKNIIENDVNSEIWNTIRELKIEKHMSWVQLREGCNAILTGSKNYRAGAKSFANTVIRETHLEVTGIIKILDTMNV